MGKRLLLAAMALTALVAVPVQAEAQSAGFCAYGICAGVDVVAPPGAAIVRFCNNIAGGCQVQVVPHGQPVNVPQTLPCTVLFPFDQVFAVVPNPGVPTGSTVISVCV